MGTLYIVATPIGNLEDITFRAIKTLKEVDFILTEDTRVTRRLLDKYEITTPVESYHQHSKDDKKAWILSQIILGKNVALVTDAGTPGISDPGNELIEYLLSGLSASNFLATPEGVTRNSASANPSALQIVPIPGASALTSALSISGMDVSSFVFIGFLPKKGRTKLFNWLKDSNTPFVFYESPYRIVKSLKALGELLGYQGTVMVARELTKMYESVYRGNFEEVLELLAKQKVKGEVVVVVDPRN
jgi:16S rRNA (cytidine1402-2'-O)-methyltransferase